VAPYNNCTIAAKAPEIGPIKVGSDQWMSVELGIAKDDGRSGLRLQLDQEGFLTSSHAGSTDTTPSYAANNSGPILQGGYKTHQQKETPSMVLDIDWWKYEAGNGVCLVGSNKSNERTRLKDGGRTWVVNVENGTISAAKTPHLVLGVDLPDLTLVNAMNSECALVFDRIDDKLDEGLAVPLTLKSHPAYAICPQTDTPQRIEEWKVSYQRLGIGSKQHALVVKRDTDFIVSSSQNFILDIPFDKFVEGTDGQTLSVLSMDNASKNKTKSRRFVMNINGTISPKAVPHLVLGIRPGMELLPTTTNANSRLGIEV